eukprot:80722_1
MSSKTDWIMAHDVSECTSQFYNVNMSADCKEQSMQAATSPHGMRFMWDVSCNSSTIDYSNDMTTATVTAKSANVYRHIRGPFWDAGRHIVNIRINHKTKDGFAIGIIDKSFNISDNIYLGSTDNSYSFYYEGTVYHNSQAIVKSSGYKDGDIVTVDINLYNRTLNFALNGQYLAEKDAITNIPKQVALGANLYYKNDSVQIVQYYQM